MTPRTIEEKFSAELLKESQMSLSKDLTLDGAIVEKKHPKVLWTQLQIENDPNFVPPKVNLDGWFYNCLNNSPEEAAIGHPWRIAQIIQEDIQVATLSFPPFGSVTISRLPLENTGNNPLLPEWLKYALSAELWGEEGKWIRFHQRLHKIFEEKELLAGPDLPGYYLLKNKIKESIENLGYTGTNLGKDYLVVLPWTFSLTDLENFEKIVREL